MEVVVIEKATFERMLSGFEIFAENAGEKSVSFDTSKWDRGMYILNVIQDKNVKSLKLIVK